MSQGVDYFQKEFDRLERVISSGSLSAKKLDEASRKTSVLGAFLDEPSAAEEPEEDDEDEVDDDEE
jgi:Endoplasmic reticulum protein ERp29, C-terminal domain